MRRVRSPHCDAKTSFSNVSALESVFTTLRVPWANTPSQCGREAKTERKGCVFKWKCNSVDMAWVRAVRIDDLYCLSIFKKSLSKHIISSPPWKCSRMDNTHFCTHTKTALSAAWEMIRTWASGSWRSGYCDHQMLRCQESHIPLVPVGLR